MQVAYIFCAKMTVKCEIYADIILLTRRTSSAIVKIVQTGKDLCIWTVR